MFELHLSKQNKIKIKFKKKKKSGWGYLFYIRKNFINFCRSVKMELIIFSTELVFLSENLHFSHLLFCCCAKKKNTRFSPLVFDILPHFFIPWNRHKFTLRPFSFNVLTKQLKEKKEKKKLKELFFLSKCKKLLFTRGNLNDNLFILNWRFSEFKN